MNKSVNLKVSLSGIVSLLERVKLVMTLALIIIMVGYTGYQISKISNVEPDQAYIQQQEQQLANIKLKPNPQTIAKLKSLQSGGDTTIPINRGKANPFSLN